MARLQVLSVVGSIVLATAAIGDDGLQVSSTACEDVSLHPGCCSAAVAPAPTLDGGYQGRYFVCRAWPPETIEELRSTQGVNFFDLFPIRNSSQRIEAALQKCRERDNFAMVYLTHGRPLSPGFPRELDPPPPVSRRLYADWSERYPQTLLMQVAEIANAATSYTSGPPKATTRVEAVRNLVGNLRRLYDYWVPPQIGKAAWENFLIPVFHFEAGTDLHILEQFRDEKGEWSGTGKKLLADLFGVELHDTALSEEGPAKIVFAAPERFGFPIDREYAALHMRLHRVKVARDGVLARTGDRQPVCVMRDHGRGAGVLTLSGWTWRLPHAFLSDLIGRIARNAGIVLELAPAKRFVETFVCPLQDGRGY